MMVICIKQHLSNILSSILITKLSNTKTELKKKAYTKKSVFKILARSPKKINKRIHFR